LWLHILVHFSHFWLFAPRKIWQPWPHLSGHLEVVLGAGRDVDLDAPPMSVDPGRQLGSIQLNFADLQFAMFST
jgi:hypothetical protein